MFPQRERDKWDQKFKFACYASFHLIPSQLKSTAVALITPHIQNKHKKKNLKKKKKKKGGFELSF
jgi:hypothetical protein